MTVSGSRMGEASKGAPLNNPSLIPTGAQTAPMNKDLNNKLANSNADNDKKYYVAVKNAQERQKNRPYFSNADLRSTIDEEYSAMKPSGGSTGAKMRGEDGDFLSMLATPIRGLKDAIDTINYGIGGGLDALYDSTIGEWTGSKDWFTGQDLATVADIVEDLGLSLLPGGVGLVVGKNLVQNSDKLYNALPGIEYDPITYDKIDKGAAAGDALGALASTALAALPAAGIGKATKIGKGISESGMNKASRTLSDAIGAEAKASAKADAAAAKYYDDLMGQLPAAEGKAAAAEVKAMDDAIAKAGTAVEEANAATLKRGTNLKNNIEAIQNRLRKDPNSQKLRDKMYEDVSRNREFISENPMMASLEKNTSKKALDNKDIRGKNYKTYQSKADEAIADAEKLNIDDYERLSKLGADYMDEAGVTAANAAQLREAEDDLYNNIYKAMGAGSRDDLAASGAAYMKDPAIKGADAAALRTAADTAAADVTNARKAISELSERYAPAQGQKITDKEISKLVSARKAAGLDEGLADDKLARQVKKGIKAERGEEKRAARKNLQEKLKKDNLSAEERAALDRELADLDLADKSGISGTILRLASNGNKEGIVDNALLNKINRRRIDRATGRADLRENPRYDINGKKRNILQRAVARQGASPMRNVATMSIADVIDNLGSILSPGYDSNRSGSDIPEELKEYFQNL